MADVVYNCQCGHNDKVVTAVDPAHIEDAGVYIKIKWEGTACSAVLSKRDALDFARRINEAFGDGNAQNANH